MVGLMTFWRNTHTHARTHPTLPLRLHIYSLLHSPQSVPSCCPGTTVSTGIKRRWHPGSPSPKFAWKRSWSAAGPSVSGTRYRRSSTKWTQRDSTRMVSAPTPHLNYFAEAFPACFSLTLSWSALFKEKRRTEFDLRLGLYALPEVVFRRVIPRLLLLRGVIIH